MKVERLSICFFAGFFFLLTGLFQFIVSPKDLFADTSPIVIGNKNISVDSLSSSDVMNIFLGKKVSWDNGSKITFVTLSDGETNKVFLRKYVKRNPSQFKNHWKKMLFTGKGVIPKSFSTEEEVIEYVTQNENTIGYISQSAAQKGLKIIPVTN